MKTDRGSTDSKLHRKAAADAVGDHKSFRQTRYGRRPVPGISQLLHQFGVFLMYPIHFIQRQIRRLRRSE